MTFVTMSLFQDRARLRWLYMVPALGIGFYGFKGGIWVLVTGGGELVFGPDMSFFADNNTLGLALCMVLPILLYLSRDEKRQWLKRILQVTFCLSIISIIFTYSRGAFLGLFVILSVLIWRSPWRMRFPTNLSQPSSPPLWPLSESGIGSGPSGSRSLPTPATRRPRRVSKPGAPLGNSPSIALSQAAAFERSGTRISGSAITARVSKTTSTHIASISRYSESTDFSVLLSISEHSSPRS